MCRRGRFRCTAVCLVAVSFIAVLFNITSLHMWESDSKLKTEPSVGWSRSTQVADYSGQVTPNSAEFTDNSTDYEYVSSTAKAPLGQKKTPIIVWWYDFFHNPGTVKQCGSVSCFFTDNRSYAEDPRTQAFIFYGSGMEFHDLPLPRKPQHEWAIIHEESPKNNWAFSNDNFMNLFNHTGTYKRTSDYPLTLTWLTSIEAVESKTYYHTAGEKNKFMKELSLAPIAYVQSDCGAPSDRDNLVKELSKHIKIDCLGKCLNNKELPKHLQDNLGTMAHNDFYELLSKYKFVMAAENAVCEDYITEKFWRSFYVGTVPIVYGSPTIKDFLPAEDTAIVVDDFKSIRSLASFIIDMNANNSAYSYYTRYKHIGVTNPLLLKMVKDRTYSAIGSFSSIHPGFAEGFECYVCKKLHSFPRTTKDISNSYFRCPKPVQFSNGSESLFTQANRDWFAQEYIYRHYQFEAFKQFYDREVNWTYLDLYNVAAENLKRENPEFVKLGILHSFKQYADANIF